jgi:methylamine utilization protein MauE
MLAHVVTEIREAQVPLLSALLLGGSAAKITRALRVGSVDAGLGPTALFPMRLRRRVALSLCAAEFVCGMALIMTAGRFGRGDLATGVRIATSLLFLVATCALIELRTSHPDVGCGCFGEFSTSPVSGRTLTRSAFLSAAALATIGLSPLQAPHPGVDAARLLGIFAAELVVIAALSPELGEALVRLGYSEPCELRRLPAVRTLAALRRSSQWRRRAGLITAEVPLDMWRELCWRYVVFPARLGERDAEIVFAVHLRPHRPVIHAALVDSATGDVLAWPATPARRGVIGWLMDLAFGPGRTFGRWRGGLAGSRDDGQRAHPGQGPANEPDAPAALARQTGHPGRPGPSGQHGPPAVAAADPASDDERAAGLLRIPAGMLAAPTDPGRGIPVIRSEQPPPAEAPGPPQAGKPQAGKPGSARSPGSPVPPRTPPDDLPFSSDL